MQRGLELVTLVAVEGKKPGMTLFHPSGHDMITVSGQIIIITNMANKNSQRYGDF